MYNSYYSILIAFLLFPVVGSGQTATSVQDGSFTNPSTWDCGCVPFPGYSVVVDHQVTMDTSWAVIGGTSFDVSSSGAFQGDGNNRNFSMTGGSTSNDGRFEITNVSVTGGTFTNNDHVGFSDFYNEATVVNNSGGTFIGTNLSSMGNFDNAGTIDVTNVFSSGVMENSGLIAPTDITNGTGGSLLITSNGKVFAENFLVQGYLENNGSIYAQDMAQTDSIGINSNTIDISGNFYNQDEFRVDAGARFYIEGNFYNGDSTQPSTWGANFVINGYASTGNNWQNVDSISGSGQWCVAGNSANEGVMTGTFDYCDTSGTGGGPDLNTGTIGSGISNCQGSIPCFQPSSIEASGNKEASVSVFPNPAKDRLTIRVESRDVRGVVLYDGFGRKVRQISISTEGEYILPVSELSSGIYYLQCISSQGSATLRKVIVE